MTKLIVLVAAVVVIVWLLKRAMGRMRAGDKPADTAKDSGTPQGELVSCARCGVNLPGTEARSVGGRLYCSEEHSRLGPRDG
jgi:uncharacterized protein